jgi:integrase
MKKPRFTHGYIDRHGRPRYYLRRPGFKQLPLPGLPWSPEFMAAYEQAMASQPRDEVGARRTIAGSMRALAVSYFQSAMFQNLEPSTQSVYRNIADRFCREHGDKRVASLRREHVESLMRARADKPDTANGLLKVLRTMMQHAVKIKLRADNPTSGVAMLAPKSKTGFHRWTEPEIAQFEARHPIGSKPRLALALGLYTAQARQDVVAMGPQHIREEVLYWVRKKTARTTGIELLIPLHPELRAIIDATPSGHLTFLVTEFGKPFAVAGFGNWFREQCDKAGLHHCTFHGLRKAAASRLAECGCTVHEIAAITGHATLKEIERYTKTADRKRLALVAMEKMKTRTFSG